MSSREENLVDPGTFEIGGQGRKLLGSKEGLGESKNNGSSQNYP